MSESVRRQSTIDLEALEKEISEASLKPTSPEREGVIAVKGLCLCDGVKFTVYGEPEDVVLCYCEICSKNAGSPYQISAQYSKSDVEISASSSTLLSTFVIRKPTLKVPINKVFCQRCGTTLWTIPMIGKGDKLLVLTSLLQDSWKDMFKPTKDVFHDRKPDWLGEALDFV